ENHYEATRLKVLFVGSMTQRKGLADLFAAMKRLNPERYELHVLGTPLLPLEFYQAKFPGMIHHHTRSHDEVLELMASCHVLALPSIVEGRALVQQEALACGLPIIVTANAGASDLVEDGKAGILVPIRSPEEIAGALDSLGNDRERLQSMSHAGLDVAREKTWAHYESLIVEAVSGVLES
ncbi:MAG: glycosyltransferase family 4 protein, partial [Puniceicoccales bacterium]